MDWFAASVDAPKRLLVRISFRADDTRSTAGRTAIHHLAAGAEAASAAIRATLYGEILLVPGLLLAQRRKPPHDRDRRWVQSALDHLRRERRLAVYTEATAPRPPPRSPSKTDVDAMAEAHRLALADVTGAIEQALAQPTKGRDTSALRDEKVLPLVDTLRATAAAVPVPSLQDPELSPEMAQALARQNLFEGAVSTLFDVTATEPRLGELGDELHAFVSMLAEPLRATVRNRTPDRDDLARYAYGEVLYRACARYLAKRLRTSR